MTGTSYWKSAVVALARGCVVLLAGNVVYATPLITAIVETGTNLDPEIAHFTGQTFDHIEEGLGFTVPTLDEDVPSFTDRTHEYNGIDAETSIANLGLVGAEYVMAANDNRGVADYRLDITVAQTVDAFVFMDTRVTQPAWLNDGGWTFLGHQLGIDESGDGVGPGDAINRSFWIWQQSGILASTFSTFERGGTGNNMYGVAVMAPGGGPGIKELSGADFTPANFGLIDLGGTDGRPEPNALADIGGIRQIGAGINLTNGVNLDPQSMTSPLDPDGFSIAIDNLDLFDIPTGNLDWRDRGDNALATYMDLPLVRLGEDFVKNNAGIVRVTLSDLPAGDYNVTSYHIDPDNSQSEMIDIYIDTGDGNGFVHWDILADASFPGGPTSNAGAPGVGGMEPQAVIDKGVTFQLTADGLNDVLILFDGTLAIDTEVPLNGLNIELIGAFAPNADFDGDGDVDGADFLTWQQGFGAAGVLADGDANNDGAVNAADLTVWENQYGTGGAASGGLAGAAVPEPATALLILVAAGSLLAWRQRR